MRRRQKPLRGRPISLTDESAKLTRRNKPAVDYPPSVGVKDGGKSSTSPRSRTPFPSLYGHGVEKGIWRARFRVTKGPERWGRRVGGRSRSRVSSAVAGAFTDFAFACFVFSVSHPVISYLLSHFGFFFHYSIPRSPCFRFVSPGARVRLRRLPRPDPDSPIALNKLYTL